MRVFGHRSLPLPPVCCGVVLCNPVLPGMSPNAHIWGTDDPHTATDNNCWLIPAVYGKRIIGRPETIR